MKRRQKDVASKEHKKQITYKECSKRLSAINFYITNIPPEYLPKEQVYDFYSFVLIVVCLVVYCLFYIKPWNFYIILYQG